MSLITLGSSPIDVDHDHARLWAAWVAKGEMHDRRMQRRIAWFWILIALGLAAWLT
jgi:hypothetical protein